MLGAGQVTISLLSVDELQDPPGALQVAGAEARTADDAEVRGTETKYVTIFKLAAAIGGGTAFASTNVRGVGVTAPSRHVVTPIVKQQSVKQQTQLPALNVAFWSENIHRVCSPEESSSIIQQLVEGVKIGRPPADTQIVSSNWPSALEHKDQVSKIIADDLGAGRLHGPFVTPPFDTFIVSPLGAFKKRGSSKIRLIHDLSFPTKGAVNASIKKEDFSLSYASVEDAAKICKELGPAPVFMAKLDLENAFKHVMVHESDWHMLGFSWPDANGRNLYYFSRVLNFGLRSAPYLFDLFASTLLKFMHLNGVPEDRVVRYVDDFIVLATSPQECQGYLDVMLSTCRSAGFSVQPSKVTTPSESTEFLGIVVDSIQKQLRISGDRLSDLTTEVAAWLGLKSATKRRLLSLIGKLAFAARVVRSGRAFLGRLLGAAKQARALHHHVRLTEETRADLLWWYKCIASHNGVSFYDVNWGNSDVIHVYSDASNTAFGAVCGAEWLQIAYVGKFSSMLSKSINWREFHAALTALATWASSLRGRAVVFHIDNMVVCHILNKLYTPVRELMHFTREWCLLVEHFNISMAVVYIDTHTNIDADDLSRLSNESFLNRNPNANRFMTWPTLPSLPGEI